MENIIDSIQPILTKVKVTDKEFDLTECQFTMSEQIKAEAEKSMVRLHQQIERNQNEVANQQSVAMINEYEKQVDFFENLSNKLVVYDPLERRIENEDEPEENQAVSQ